MVENNFLIIAHYHRNGEIRNDTIKLLKYAQKKFKRIYFISTNLRKDQEKRIPKKVKISKRKNEGYDFYSWRIGIKNFLKDNGRNLENKQIYLLGTGLYCLRPNKFLNKFLSYKNKFKHKVWSLSKSYEINQHLQSDFLSFSAKLLHQKEFYKWWFSIKKQKKRSTIVMRYEIGFSKFLLENNYKIDCIFQENLRLLPDTFLKKMRQKVIDVFFKTPKLYKKNPTHYFYKEFFDVFGVFKIELIKKNPININLDYLYKINNKKIIKEALNN